MLKVLTTSILMALPASSRLLTRRTAPVARPTAEEGRVTDGARRARGRCRRRPPRSRAAVRRGARPGRRRAHPRRPVDRCRRARCYARRTDAFWWVAADCLLGAASAGGAPARPPGSRRATPPRRVRRRRGSSARVCAWDVAARAGARADGRGDRARLGGPERRARARAPRPSIERVCLASGATTAALFARHNARWLREPGRPALAYDAKTRRARPRRPGRAALRRSGLLAADHAVRDGEREPSLLPPTQRDVPSYAAKLADWERLCFCER